jgi:hypothetical protein
LAAKRPTRYTSVGQSEGHRAREAGEHADGEPQGADEVKIVEIHSHLSGLEYMHYHKIDLWNEVQSVITAADAVTCLKKLPKETQQLGDVPYSAKKLTVVMNEKLASHGWLEPRVAYSVVKNTRRGGGSSNQAAHVKDRVMVDAQFGRRAFIGSSLFAKSMAFFVDDVVDLGINILPVRALQSRTSPGSVYYEAETYNLMRAGRAVPAVPLVLIGVAP